MQQWDPSSKEKEFMGDDGKWNWREKRKYKKYQKSDKAKYDQWNYEMNQKSQFYNSAYDFYKTMLARQAGAAYVKPEVKPEVKPADLNPPVDPVDPVDPVPLVVEEVDWAEIGKQHGLYSSQQVKELQKKLGLPETGDLDDTTLKGKAWYEKMKELGYTEDVAANGVVSFKNPQGQNYYSDGTMYKSGNKVSYDYKTLPKVVPILPTLTENQFRNNGYFRNHKTAGTTITIDGVTYPIMVSQNFEENNPFGIINDVTYAFDRSTGKIREVYENGFGGINPLGNSRFTNSSKWIDANEFLIQGAKEYAELMAREQAWLRANPKPKGNNYKLRMWTNKYADAKRAGFKKQGGLISKKDYKIIDKINNIHINKQGGTMKTKYFQQGGAAPQQDMQQQVIALVQAAMQGDQKATETVNKIMEAAKAGDQQAMQIAQMIQAVAEQMQGQATAAKWGAKLNYIRSLKYAKGGKTCPTCNQKIEMKACGGKKAKKRYFGGWL